MSQDARRDDEAAAQRRARILNFPYIDTSQIANKQLYPDLLSVTELYQLRVVPLQADQSHITFGVTNTTSQQTMQSLQQRFLDQRVNYVLISDAGYQDYMRLYDPPKEVKYEDIEIKATENTTQIENISATLEQVRADDMLAYLVKQAYQLKASDIHLETGKDDVRVRIRVDGVLHPIARIGNDKYRQLMSSLAIAANISTGAPDAQTGHINRTMTMADGSNVTVNLRVETVPTSYGQDAVLRLFNFRPELLNLDNLGLSEEERGIVDNIISHPNGLVLIVGPTGSGKTTTLYSLINQLNRDDRKIITLEDPIEYNIDGITQIPVDSREQENGFGAKLRAVLRLDPDIIMVGEIRDFDTAKTALQASLTGHLVLSTYHASSAAAAISRMLDAIGENPLFVNSIKLVTAQRLVRRLDDKTKQAYQPSPAELEHLQSVIDTLPPQLQKPNLQGVTLFKAGTSDENPFGFTGQMAIRELLLMTPQMETLLRRPPHEISTKEIEQVAVQDGMTTLLHEGIFKVLAGETTLEEIFRVTG
jgi:type II secretory ATPase GspE/PulE/Tfp pilus assembly ATPase PilB-like protein